MKNMITEAGVKKRSWELPRHTLTLGGRWFTRKRAWDNAERMSQDGVDIIDIGGESTRPGAQAISEEEEIRRVQKFIDVMIKMIGCATYSIDTTKAPVARVALDAGVEIVNDISGL